MTKIDKNASKLKKIDYFGKSTQFSLLVHTVVSHGSGLGREVYSGCDRGPLRTQKWWAGAMIEKIIRVFGQEQ